MENWTTSANARLIWELIQTEMEYVADLETIENVFVTSLREADVPIIERSRLEIFLDDAFHNYRSLLEVHQRLLENLEARQLEQHPNFGMISDLILDAALNWQEAYMEYITHYPIAKYKVEEEKARNPRFEAFLSVCPVGFRQVVVDNVAGLPEKPNDQPTRHPALHSSPGGSIAPI